MTSQGPWRICRWAPPRSSRASPRPPASTSGKGLVEDRCDKAGIVPCIRITITKNTHVPLIIRRFDERGRAVECPAPAQAEMVDALRGLPQPTGTHLRFED